MRKTLLNLLLLLTCVIPGLGQYGNAWIDFSKTYYKFSLSEDGLYRISHQTLADAGLAHISGAQYRLYHNGAEVAIYTSTDELFSAGDFIEFYGMKNRGEMDRPLYPNPDSDQLNPRYSMFTDDAAYFLTFDEEGGGLRINSQVNDISSPPAAESYYMHVDEWIYSDHAEDPRNANEATFISYARYQTCEGFARSFLSSFVIDIPATSAVANGPDAQLSVRLASSTLTTHNITASFAGQPFLMNGTFPNYHLYQETASLSAGAVNNTQQLEILDMAASGRFSLANIIWTYPRQYDFTGRNAAYFEHQATGAVQYFEFQNLAHGGNDPVLVDVNARVRLIGTRNGNTVRFLLPEFTGERRIAVASQVDGIRFVEELTERTFTDYTSDDTEYIIITHPMLRTGADVVKDYADYRGSAEGGGYNVNIYHITDIYDQFGYGIERHPQSVRNFNKFIQEHWDDAKMVLIIGKGIVYTQSRREGTSANENILVPTYGNPGADQLFFTENGVSLPPFPVGRLPVTTSEQLQNYLSKLKEYDQVSSAGQTITDRAWTKRILHLGGGFDASQQTLILSLLNQMGNNAIHSEFGAWITTFTKSSTNPIGQSNSDLLLGILRGGTSLVKFFGHSSATTLDFQINNPGDWQNKGKYPIFSAMGCRAGDIHQNYENLSERFVLEPDGGVIAFVASTGSQYLSALGNWGREWYDTFGHGVNSMTLGETVLESLGALNQFGSLSSVILIEQQVIVGDPAVPFHSTPGPDYVWDYQSLKISPENITTSDDVFTISCDLVNIGTNLPDSALVSVRQKFPDGHIETIHTEQVYVTNFRTAHTFELPVKRNSAGLNRLYLHFDSDNTIAELPDPIAEQNNILIDALGTEGVAVVVLDNRALATYPQEFSVVTDFRPELTASSTNALAKNQTFVFEIDTTAQFNSTLLKREYFTQFGGTITWLPPVSFMPGTVYYWRVSTVGSGPDPEYVWDESSFLYDPGGERGWNQSHYYQFLKDDYDRLQLSDQRRFEFLKSAQSVWVQNAVDTGEVERFKFFINNANRIEFYRSWKPDDAHVFVAAFDPVTGEPMINPIGGAYGAINPYPITRPVFPYSTATAESRADLMTFIEDIIPSDYYVVFYTYQRHGFLSYFPEQWAADSLVYSKNIFSVIENIYSESQIRSLQNGSVPYTLFFQKDVGVIRERIAAEYGETVDVESSFLYVNTEGSSNSTVIGPASFWSRVEWTHSEKEAQDSMLLTVYALAKDQSEILVADHVNASVIDLLAVDAKEYPYLRLRFSAKDFSDTRSAPQLEQWRVIYEGLPEFVYNPAGGYEFQKDTLRIGESLYFMTLIKNISPYPSEGFEVKYLITDSENNVTEKIDNVPPLDPGSSDVIELEQPMIGNPGDHFFFVELNPESVSSEIHHYNNFGLRKFYVIADRGKPVLDVTFDGRHLLDGDVVSAKPEVIVTLLDDNALVPVTDRNHFEISLRKPGDFDFQALDVHSPEFDFVPSDPTNSILSASVIWRPELLEDGLYAFRAIARDGSGNKPNAPYEVSFEVLGDARVLDVTAIPNPFRDQVRFSLTLTGHQAPERFNIQITDVTGQIVRILDHEDFGIVFVGSHEIDITWDGTAEAGGLVSPGMYFYEIQAVGQDGRPYQFNTRNGQAGKLLFIR